MRRLILALIILLSLSSCGSKSEELDPPRNRIVYGLTLEPSGIDPHIHRSSELGIVLLQVYDTLIFRDPNTGEFVPGLAESWTVSDDGLTYTFNLRHDVIFHDDTPFNAQAVATNLDRIVNPLTASQRAAFMLGSYTGYEIIDDYTIRLILSEPYAPLLDSLSQVYLAMASPAALEEYSDNRYQFHQVGTGPYKFVKYTPGSEIVIRRNDDYNWGPSFYNPPSENTPDEIVYRFFTDPPTRSLALESGEAQIMGELLPSDARAFTGNSEIRILPTSIPGQPLQFIMNTQNFPTDILAVRQALIFATNRNVIVDTVFQGFSPVAWGPLAEGTEFYSSELVGLYPHDTTQAKALISSVGFNDADGNGYFDAGDGDFEVIVLVPPWGLVPQVAQLLQDQWREAGIKVILQPVPGFNALRERVATGDYNLVAFDTPGYDPAFLNDFFVTGAPLNYARYSNPELDNALLTAVRESSPGVRRGIYAQAQKFIMDQALILPIREYANLNASIRSIENLQFDAYGWFPIMNNVTIAGS
jgi:peptide/nickel transport system substrate-binding protein